MYLLACLYSYAKSRMISILTYILPTKLARMASHQHIDESAQIQQLHTDTTSHKGTEIVNVVCGILTKNNALRTICLAGDITAEDGTTKYQSLTIVNQFSESGRLLGRWCDNNVHQ